MLDSVRFRNCHSGLEPESTGGDVSEAWMPAGSPLGVGMTLDAGMTKVLQAVIGHGVEPESTP